LQSVTKPKTGVLVTIALLSNESSVREVLKTGAKFILHKPFTAEQAAPSLRAATALLRRERRCAYRVPVQAPVQLSLPGGDPIEGIMLDLSQTGMDVLAAQPLLPAALISLRFTLPDGSVEIDAHGELAWANSNGQRWVCFFFRQPPGTIRTAQRVGAGEFSRRTTRRGRPCFRLQADGPQLGRMLC